MQTLLIFFSALFAASNAARVAAETLNKNISAVFLCIEAALGVFAWACMLSLVISLNPALIVRSYMDHLFATGFILAALLISSYVEKRIGKREDGVLRSRAR